MSGSIKVGGHTVFVHTGASGAGTLSVQGQNGNVLLSDDGTAVFLGNNVRLPASGGIKDSSGNNILTESGGNVSVGNIRLPASGGIKDSSGNNILTESGGNVSIGDIRLHTNSSVRDSSGNAIITDVAGSAVVASSAGGIPPGAIMSFAMSSAPSGWVVCNGAEYAIADYGDLHTAIGTTWGALTNGSGGAGSTHFRVPDLRGEFLRGFDNGQGNDPDASSRTGGDAIGSSQNAGVKYGQVIFQGSGLSEYILTNAPNASQNAATFKVTGVYDGRTFDGGGTEGSFYFGDSGVTQTRPRNKYVQYCIKY